MVISCCLQVVQDVAVAACFDFMINQRPVCSFAESKSWYSPEAGVLCIFLHGLAVPGTWHKHVEYLVPGYHTGKDTGMNFDQVPTGTRYATTYHRSFAVSATFGLCSKMFFESPRRANEQQFLVHIGGQYCPVPLPCLTVLKIWYRERQKFYPVVLGVEIFFTFWYIEYSTNGPMEPCSMPWYRPRNSTTIQQGMKWD